MDRGAERRKIYYGWWMVVLLFFTLISTAGNYFYAFSVYVPRLIEEFDCTTSSLMLSAAVWSIVFGFSSPVIGSLMHRHGVRKIFITGIMVSGILMLLMSCMTRLWHLYLINMLAGFAAAATVLVPSQTLITSWFRRRRGVAMALMMMGIGMGGFLVPQLVAWLIEQLGWRNSFRVGALINYLVVLPPLLLFLKDRPADLGLKIDGVPGGDEDGPGETAVLGVSARKAAKTAVFWLIVSVFVLQLFAVSGININVQNFAEKQMGYSILTAAHFMAFALLVTVPARFAFGWLCDRLDPKYLIGSAGLFVLCGSFVLWLFVIERGWIDDYRAINLFALFHGFGIAGNAVALPILVGRCFGEREFSRIIGLVMASFAVGVLLGPVVMGKIFDLTGSYQGAFFVAMAVAGLSAVLALLIRTDSLRSGFTSA